MEIAHYQPVGFFANESEALNFRQDIIDLGCKKTDVLCLYRDDLSGNRMYIVLVLRKEGV